jgi:outer membrane protein OmpA-like peptidoglycan-associated protein
MRSPALLAASALLLAGCAAQTVPAPPPPPPQHKAEAPPVHARPVAPPDKHEPPPPPSQVRGPLSRQLAGAYMDAQETELRLKLRGSGLRVARIGDDISITIPVGFLFDEQPEGVSWDGSGVLSALASVIQQYDHTVVEIGSYTDTTGSSEANQRASDVRAKIVADVLARDGVAPGRISARGFGETHLLVPTGDNVNQPRNRRIEIRIVPKIEA